MTPVEVTERAAADVVGLVDYLAEANAAVARNFIDGFERAVERLAPFPNPARSCTTVASVTNAWSSSTPLG